MPYYYHVRINDSRNETHVKLDIRDLAIIKRDIVIPFIAGKDFRLQGAELRRELVDRISITRSSQKSSDCADISLKNKLLTDSIPISPVSCVFDNPDYADDITDRVLRSVKANTPQQTFEIEIHSLRAEHSLLRSFAVDVGATTRALLEQKVRRRLLFTQGAIVLVLLGPLVAVNYLLYKFGPESIHPYLVAAEVSLAVFAGIVFVVSGKRVEVELLLRSYIKKRQKVIRERIFTKFLFNAADEVLAQQQLLASNNDPIGADN